MIVRDRWNMDYKNINLGDTLSEASVVSTLVFLSIFGTKLIIVIDWGLNNGCDACLKHI